jgi:N-methylhydantoinase A
MGLTANEAALGVIHVANVNIERALRRISIARGHDPRCFTLVAFGGAGPLHACAVADRLAIPRVLLPPHPGVLCALGMLMADMVLEESRSVLERVSAASTRRLQRALKGMARRARERLIDEGLEPEAIVLRGLVDARYEGQSYELIIPLARDLATAFHAAHAETYGHAMPDRTVEVVNLRLQAIGRVAGPELTPEPVVENDGQEARLGEKAGCLGTSDASRYALYQRDRLRPGAAMDGPALLFQMDSTAFIPPDWTARVDGYHNLILEKRL